MSIDKEKHLTIKQKRIFTGIALVLLLIFCSFLCVAIGKPMLEFVKEPEQFKAWVDSMGIWGRLAFLGMVIVQVVLAIIPGEPIEIVAGYAFGAIEGSMLCLIGMVLGGIIVFALVRSIGIRMVEVFFPIEKIRSLKFLQKTRRLNTITFILFFLPGTPKDLISYFIGLTEMKWQTWLLINLFARIPSVITSTIGGNALGGKKYIDAIIVFGITLVLSLVGILIYKLIIKSKNLHVEKEKQELKNLYLQGFCCEEKFTTALFEQMFDYCSYLKKQGEIVSMLFKIPCEINVSENKYKGYYLYGLTTHPKHRGKGYIKELVLKETKDTSLYFVKPLKEDLISFYSALGFTKVLSYTEKECETKIKVIPSQEKLSLIKGITPKEFIVMYKGESEINEVNFNFPLC